MDGNSLKKVLIITGGSLDYDWAMQYVKTLDHDMVIAADRGLLHCLKLGIKPDYCLGDFDSFEGGVSGAKAVFGEDIKQYPCEKDDTDTLLAIRAAFELGCKRGVLLGATGTRLDHVLANVGNLFIAKKKGFDLEIIDKNNRIYALIGNAAKGEPGMAYFTKNGCYGDYVSVLAFGGDVMGISYEGFKYELHDAVLEAGNSIGVSNELVKETGTITIKSGMAVIMETKD